VLFACCLTRVATKKPTSSTIKSAKTAMYSRNINKFIKKVSTKAAETAKSQPLKLKRTEPTNVTLH